MRLSATRVSYAPDAGFLLAAENPQTLEFCSQTRLRTVARISLLTDVRIGWCLDLDGYLSLSWFFPVRLRVLLCVSVALGGRWSCPSAPPSIWLPFFFFSSLLLLGYSRSEAESILSDGMIFSRHREALQASAWSTRRLSSLPSVTPVG